MEQKRKLKVYYKFAKSGNRNRRSPEIRLTGNWLRNWGFSYGEQIFVKSIEKGTLIISEKTKLPPTIFL